MSIKSTHFQWYVKYSYKCWVYLTYTAIEYDNYVSSLPPSVLFHVEKQLDWDNDMDADLREMAYYMENWDLKLASSLKLTEADTDRINRKYSEDPVLQRCEFFFYWINSGISPLF